MRTWHIPDVAAAALPLVGAAVSAWLFVRARRSGDRLAAAVAVIPFFVFLVAEVVYLSGAAFL